MRTLIYDDASHEPLTIIDIPPQSMHAIVSGGRREVTYSILPPLGFLPPAGSAVQVEVPKIEKVRLRFESISRGEDPKPFLWLCIPADKDTTALIRSTFLAGDRSVTNRLKEEAILTGLRRALSIEPTPVEQPAAKRIPSEGTASG